MRKYPPECYGKGIYEYWKLKKDSIQLIIEGKRKGDPIATFIGILMTTVWSVDDILQAIGGKIDRTLLPKDECQKCSYLEGCFGAAVAMIINEIKEEMKEDVNKRAV